MEKHKVVQRNENLDIQSALPFESHPKHTHTLLHQVLVGCSDHILVGGSFQLGGACCIQ